MMRRHVVRALAALIASLSAGCGPFFLDAEIEEVCYAVQQAIPAAPTTVAGTVRLPLEYTLGYPAEAGAAVELLRVELEAEGVPSLAFVDALEVRTMGGCGAGHAATGVEPCAGATPRTVLTYRRSGAVGSALVLPAAEPVDLTNSLLGDRVKLEAHLAGKLPERAWSLGARACFRVHSQLLEPER